MATIYLYSQLKKEILALMSSFAGGSERRCYYRIVYPVRLIQLFIKLLNTRIKIERDKQKSGFEKIEDAHLGQFLPIFHYEDFAFPVLDISEGGFKVQWRSSSEPSPMMSKRIVGRLVFNPNLDKVLEFFPPDMQEVASDFLVIAKANGYEHQFEARIARKIENPRDPYPLLSLQFVAESRLEPRFIRTQEGVLIKLFREQYLDRVRAHRQRFKTFTLKS